MNDASDNEIKHPYRNLGPKESADSPENESVDSAPPIADNKSPVKQSVFQTPVEANQAPQAIPDDMRAIAEAQAAERERLYIAWDKKRLRHTITSMIILALASYVLALPTTANLTFPIGSCILGMLSGFIIAWNRIDDFWSRIIHTLPQIIWSIISLLAAWQITGFAFAIVAGVWLFHFCIATLVALKIKFDGSSH